jgi:hypothetical protein
MRPLLKSDAQFGDLLSVSCIEEKTKARKSDILGIDSTKIEAISDDASSARKSSDSVE